MKKIIAASLIIFSAFNLYADTTTPDEFRLEKEKKRDKRMPEADYLEYRYENEGIYLYPCMYYEAGTLSIAGVDNSFSLSSEVSLSTGDYVYTGTLKGTYTITVVTDTETAFSGIITIK